MMCLQRCCKNLLFCKVCEGTDQHHLSPEMVGAQMIQEAGLVFSCSSLGDVTPGTSFYITGTILQNCERFSINLMLGLHQKDIALHINPRLPQNYIVRNCKINGSWGKEEVTSALPFSLKRGHRFAMQVLVTEAEYYISVGGRHFAAFRHRLPFGRVTCLQVVGDVTDVQVEQLDVMEYPDKMVSCGSSATPTTTRNDNESGGNVDEDANIVRTIPSLSEAEANNNNINANFMEMPYYGKLADKLMPGTRLNIYGQVKLLPHSFFVNLQRGDKIWPHPIIAFHFNPRFANVGGRHVICRNSWLDGRWDREERNEISTDFMPGRHFHLAIDCCDAGYNVTVNDKFIAEYRFRTPPSIVDTIYIQGDIKLMRLGLDASPSPSGRDDDDFVQVM